MQMAGGLFYTLMVYAHLLLFVLWLGADIGVFILSQFFRKPATYSFDQRLALVKLLVIVDLIPRIAWALMVPVSLTLSDMGIWWDVPDPLVRASWFVGGVWIWLMLDSHRYDMTPRATRNRRWEGWLRGILCVFFLALGLTSLATGEPIAPDWLAAKALMFGLIFAAAILIDVSFNPVGGLLGKLTTEGSGDEIEIPLLRAMNRTRIWVWCIYLLLLAAAWLGLAGPRGVSGLS
jgi:hypothetical protein